MKNLYLFLAFTISVLLHFISFSQCEIAGGDFENLQDISSELVEEGFFDFCTDSMIIGSPQFSSLGRVTLLSFAESFGALEGVSCQQIYGMYPHDTGANGTASALKLQTDTILNLADAVSVIPCDTLPKLLKGSVLHVGSELDTADVVIAINYSFARGTADLSGILRIAGGSDEFTEFEIPVEIKDEEIEVNTVSIFLIVESDEDHLEAGNESYYVFDELELVYNDPVSSVSDNEIYNFTMSPNPVNHFTNIALPNNTINHISVYNENGVLVLEQNEISDFSTSLDVSQLSEGLYVVDIVGKDFRLTKKLIKL